MADVAAEHFHQENSNFDFDFDFDFQPIEGYDDGVLEAPPRELPFDASILPITHTPWTWTANVLESTDARDLIFFVLNPILQFYGINNLRGFMEKLDERSDDYFSAERKYLRHVLGKFYAPSLDNMAQKIRDEASKCLTQLFESLCDYEFYVSRGTLLDKLCLQSLQSLEAIKDDQGGHLFHGLRARVIKDNYDAEELISIIKTFPSNTDLGQVISMMKETWIGEPLGKLFDMELHEHSFAVNGKPITVGNVVARVSWQCGIYPAWIQELHESKMFGCEVKSVLNELDVVRAKYKSSLTSLLLPQGLKGEAKRIHGRLVHSNPKILLGNVRLLEKDQHQCIFKLERIWGKFVEEEEKSRNVQRWMEQLQTLGLKVQDLESVLEHMKRKGGEKSSHAAKRSRH